VEYIAQAKRRGVKVTAETCPHYFSLTDEAILKSGVNAKMNPPLRSREDTAGIIDALKSGIIDCISTDHAPHLPADKFEDAAFPYCLREAANGIIGLESSFALGVTYLVKPGHITLEKLIELMSSNPAKILGIDDKFGTIEEGKTADFTIFNTDEKFIFDKNNSPSKSRNTPFHGFELYGRILYTIIGGALVYGSHLK
jgi:dihydroorotase